MSISYRPEWILKTYHTGHFFCPKCQPEWNLLLGRVTDEDGPHMWCMKCESIFEMPTIELQERPACEQR